MAGELLLRCVPDPNNGPGTSPCPPGQIVTTVEAQLPTLIAIEDWGSVAVISGTALILAYAFGLVIGLAMKHMKEALS